MASDTIYIGLDPGVSGGMAAVRCDGSIFAIAAWDSEASAHEFISAVQDEAGDSYHDCNIEAAIERVGGFIKGNPAPGSAMFKFGESFGWLRGLLAGKQIPYCTVRPQDWQKGLGVTGKQLARKRSLKDIAAQRFPQAKPTLKTADALLIADWLRRQSVGQNRS